MAPERLDRWLDGFVARHGPSEIVRSAQSLDVRGADGTTATGVLFDHDPVGILLIRRGGYAVALASQGTLTNHKLGSRYVQSRTAAGGWSQQRFARRRANQADSLIEATAARALEVILGGDADGTATGRPAGLVIGGDRSLCASVLAEPRLRVLRPLPRRELPDLPDPNRRTLDEAVRRGRAVRIHVVDTASAERSSPGELA